MSLLRAVKRAFAAGALCVVVAACDAEDNDCTCTLNQTPFNTVEVSTPASCSDYAEEHAEQYSSCIESSASITGPSRPLSMFLAPRPGGLMAWLQPRVTRSEATLLTAQLEEIAGTRYLW